MVMTFSKPRVALGHHKYSDNTYELVRLCGNNSFYVIGGASKLLKHFENDYNPQKIITYSDIRYSDGDVYNKLGFSWIKQNPPSYFYTKNYMEKVHRFSFRKNILSKKMKKFDASKTEWENMKDNGWIRVWDCGTMVFEKMY